LTDAQKKFTNLDLVFVIRSLKNNIDIFNPISQLAIRPMLWAVDASRNPIRGGIAAALASGAAHYALIELANQIIGSNGTVDLSFSELPIGVHAAVTANMIANYGIGIDKSLNK